MPDNERETREVRGAENPADSSPTDSHGKGEVTGSSKIAGSVSVRTTRADRQGTDYFGTLAGGIIGQLIQQCEERLSEANECIDWYTREVDKIEKRLADLRQLENLANQDQQE